MSIPTKLEAPPEHPAIMAAESKPPARGFRQPSRMFAIFVLVLGGIYAQPLYRLLRYGMDNPLWSHVLLVPAVSLYLAWTKRRLPTAAGSFSMYAGIPLTLAMIVLSAFWMARLAGVEIAANDSLCIIILSFVLFLIAGGAWIFGPERARGLAFPLGFLLFMVPFPTFVTHAIEVFFQHASADAASLMFAAGGTPVLRDGLFFKLPGITIEVAEECSGIRSTLVLFITSLVGAYLFFQSRIHRTLLALAIIPIAIIRNGFRIFTIAMLCVHVGPDMIHSWIHKRGGPVFFALSLIPFFALLIYLNRRERLGPIRRAKISSPPHH